MASDLMEVDSVAHQILNKYKVVRVRQYTGMAPVVKAVSAPL